MGTAGSIRAGKAHIEIGTDNGPLGKGLMDAEHMLKGLGQKIGSKSFLSMALKTAAGGGAIAGVTFLAKQLEEATGKLASVMSRVRGGTAGFGELSHALLGMLPGVESLGTAFHNLWSAVSGGETAGGSKAALAALAELDAMVVKLSQGRKLAEAPEGMEAKIKALQEYGETLANIDKQTTKAKAGGADPAAVARDESDAKESAYKTYQANVAKMEKAAADKQEKERLAGIQSRMHALNSAAHAEVAAKGDAYQTELDSIERNSAEEINALHDAGKEKEAQLRLRQYEAEKDKAWLDERARLQKKADDEMADQNRTIADARKKDEAELHDEITLYADEQQRARSEDTANALLQADLDAGGRETPATKRRKLDIEMQSKITEEHYAGRGTAGLEKEWELRRQLIDQEATRSGARVSGAWGGAGLERGGQNAAMQKTLEKMAKDLDFIRRQGGMQFGG